MRRIVSSVAGFVLGILFAFQASAQDVPIARSQELWLRAHPTVTVAVYKHDWPPFEEWNGGEPRGLAVDYLEDSLARLGVTPRYRVYDSWPDMVRAACEGEVDLVMNVSITAGRTGCMVFTQEYVQVPIAVVARQDDPRPLASNDFDGLRVVTERGFSTGQAARVRYPGASYQEADNTLEALQAVADGKVDIYIGNAYAAAQLMQLHGISNIGLARMSGLSLYPLHFAGPNANRPLAEAINSAMQAISPAQREAIELKWLPNLEWMNEQDSIFTAEEKAALAAGFTLGFPPQAAPISYRDERGQPSGLVADYLHRFQEMGADFTPSQAESWGEVRQAMLDGKVDAVITVANPLDGGRDWIHSLPIVSIPNVIVIRGNAKESVLGLRDLSGMTVAVSDPERLGPLISRAARGATIVDASDARQGLELVRSRKAHAYVGNLAVVDALVRERFAGELRVAAPAGFEDNFVFSARQSHALVVAAFDRMLASMSPREREAIRGDWLAVEYRGGMNWHRLLRWVLPILAVLAIIMFIHARGYRRLRAEVEQRRAIEKRFAEVTNNLPAVVHQATLSESGEVTFPFIVGDLPALFGITAEEAMANGEVLIDRIDPSDRVHLRQAIARAVADGGGFDLDFRTQAEHGTRWIRANSLPYQTDDNRWHWTGYWIDVTDQRRQWQDLLEAKASAEDALKAKADFLAMMSHEIRTPMSGVIGLLEILSYTPLDEEQQTIVDTIGDSAQMLRQILDDILDYSKMEAGALELDASPFSLRQVVQGAVQMLTPLSDGKQLPIHATLDPRIAEEHIGDDVRMRQILFNLLSNAIKFTDQGRVDVNVMLKAENNGSQTLQLSVSDTGIGISEDQQGRLFQPFTQAEPSTARHFGGTGLGLSICHQIVSLMGGTISLQSRLGEGTTVAVEVTLPIAASHPSAHGDETVKRSLPRMSANFDRSRARILIAEDHPTNRTLLAWYMQQLGLAFDMVENGAEALRALETGRYNLLLTDCLMPVMDGYALAREIRQREASTDQRRLPIVAITASVYKGEVELCTNAGMDDYLAKPVSLSALATTLEHWLQDDLAKGHASRHVAEAPATNAPFGQDVLSSLITQYGSARIAIEMLRGFCVATREDIDRIRSDADGSGKDLANIFHRIVGGLYAINQSALADRAKELEHRLIDQTATGEQVEAFTARLDVLIEEIQATPALMEFD